MDRPAKGEVTAKGNNELIMTGKTSDFEKVKGNLLQFEARIKILANGGTITSADTALTVTGANVATIYISIGTNFNNYNDITANAGERAGGYLAKRSEENL